MRVKASSDGFNINYFDLALANPVLGFNEKQLDEVKLYPNPVSADFKLEFINDSHGSVKIGLYNMNGILVDQIFDGILSNGEQFFVFSLKEEFEHGLYILEIRNSKKRYLKKTLY